MDTMNARPIAVAPRLIAVVAATVALLLPLVPGAASAQWWKEPPANRLDVKKVEGDTAARVKWDDGYIQVKAGATADPVLALNPAHARGLALDAARQLGYFKLAEIIEGVSIDGVTVVKNAMVADQTVRSTVQARIKGAVVISENVRDVPGGGVWAEVEMGLRLRGPGGVADPVTTWAAGRPADRYPADQRIRANEHYTGLIIDASDAGFSPALAPRVLEEGTTKPVFPQGPVGYAVAMSEARLAGGAGANPLIVRAVKASGTRNGDLVVSQRDAERVLAADRAGGFLSKGAVVVVYGKERRELAAHPGKQHALVIGIDEYTGQGQGGYTKLSAAERDAKALGQLLARGAGGVTVLENRAATRAKVIEALQGLRGRVRDEDSVVLFFAGHGSVGPGDDGRLHYYLVPHDGEVAKLSQTALMDDRLEELIGNLPARQVIVILDACYSGGGTGVIRARGVANPTGPRPAPRAFVEASAGRVVISASAPDQPAFEDDQRGGLLTSYILEGLRGAADLDGDGAVTVLELYQFVSPRVREYARRNYQMEQTPVLEVRGLSGEIVLTRR
jgi:hypothetical protein